MDPASIWAKRGGRKGAVGAFHPLACHLVDVAEVARQLLAEVISPAERWWLCDGLGISAESAKRWLVIWAGLHDLGKACAGFQEQIPGNARDVPHGTVSTAILRSLFTGPLFGIDGRTAKRLATVIGGHHGAIPLNAQINQVARKVSDAGWPRTWNELVGQFLDLFPVPDEKPVALDNARAMWLAGFVSAADWVGSNVSFFPYAAPDGVLSDDFTLVQYWQNVAMPASRRALHDLGWLAVPTTTQPLRFSELFPKIPQPNDLQRQVVQVASAMDQPGLVIIEAPMGEGKTEAALYLADHASAHWDMRGAYVALPTMATSNQMFGRVREFLGHRYDDQFVQLQLLHGHAALSEDIEALRANFEAYLSFTDHIGGIDGAGEEAELASAVASAWFTGRKQGMLAPFGVGTIDQLLLSVLPVKHFFVRLFGLSNKTVILDEVHAYDAYMTTLLERLLSWLAAMSCHVVLLSATLPAEKRARLHAAYQGRRDDQPPAIAPCSEYAYPRITWVSGERSGSIQVRASDRGTKRLAIRWLDSSVSDSDDTLANELGAALANGGCAAVICNTVRRSQEVFAALLASGRFLREELDLFHARFLFKERRKREQRCLERFGRPDPDGTDDGKRPPRMVLVATQVIEQSLDLDFDLMVTELAPVDLLLQRAGRLYRHARPIRPRGLEAPTLWVMAPHMDDGIPWFERGSEYVYFPHVLLRTWWELKDRAGIDVPNDVTTLIEAVYGDHGIPAALPETLRERWIRSAGKMAKAEETDARIAEQWQIRWPGTSGELGEIMPRVLEDEDAEAHPGVRAQTRLAEPSVTVVCHRGPFRHALFEPGDPPMNLGEPNRDLARLCLEHSVTITQRDVVNDLLHESPPKSWVRNSFLRSMRPIQLDAMLGPAAREWQMVIDPDLGVCIESTKGE